MPNRIEYFEIRVTNYEKSESFYREVLGWDITKESEHPYGHIKTGEGINGGLAENKPGKPPRVMLYIEVESIEEKLKEIEAQGGKTLIPKTLISEEYGYYAAFEDPDGNVLGLAAHQ